MCERWRSLARRLGLGHALADLCTPTLGSRRCLATRVTTENVFICRRGRGDPECLQRLLVLWQRQSSETYTVRTLKSLLAAEGLHDMWMWINMMTQESPLKSEVAMAMYNRLPASPSTTTSPTSPWSAHLYSRRPNSPYSAFFQPNSSPSSTFNDYSSFASLSSSPTSSRPQSRSSQTSDMQPYGYSR